MSIIEQFLIGMPDLLILKRSMFPFYWKTKYNYDNDI